MTTKTALITGATSGIGMATALLFAQNGIRLIITGRRNDRLIALKQQLESEYHVEVIALCFDIRSNAEVEAAIKGLPETWQKIDILINNAGLAAGFGSFEKGKPDHWEQMIDTNVKGLMYITRMVAPLMIEQMQGHIVNIGSIAGKEVYPGGNVYNASKFAVDALTKAFRMDFLPYGIRVTSINPGMVETEFSLVRFDGDAQAAKNVYKGLQPLSAADIADTIWFVVSRPSHVNIGDIYITPTAQANAYFSHRVE